MQTPKATFILKFPQNTVPTLFSGPSTKKRTEVFRKICDFLFKLRSTRSYNH